MKKKVLLVLNSMATTGGFKAILQSAIDLKDEYDFSFLIPKNSKIEHAITEQGFESVRLHFVEISRRPFDIIRYLPFLLFNAFKLLAIIRKSEVSIVHSNDIYNLVPIISKILAPRAKLVVHCRILSVNFPMALYKFWVWLTRMVADRIICVSSAASEAFPHLSKKIVIHDRVDDLGFKVKETYEIKALPRLLYLANYTPGKGHYFALEVAKKLKERKIDFSWHFFGGTLENPKNDNFKSNLAAFIAKQQLNDNVILHTTHVKARSLFFQYDLFCNFSESESLSLTTIEAGLAAMPIIVTDCGGPNDFINDSYNGFLVENRNVNSMLKAVENLLANKEKRETFGKHARQTVLATFSKQNTSLTLKREYDKLIN